jgi:orotidine-5'-phosphate decarboxylase
MKRNELIANIKSKRSFLCVGLDSDPERIPAHLGTGPDAMLEFNKSIIDATKEFTVAYKPNTAFYEALGADGWQVLADTIAHIPDDCFIIADAKRGDIGNTAEQYAKAFFSDLNVDSITLSPYMGRDSISPFLGREGKWAIMLGITSNPGANDFQLIHTDSGKAVYESVIEKGKEWGGPHELMFVVGATRPEQLVQVRRLASDHFFLVPGVGAQGGDLQSVMKAGFNKDIGLLVNSSRGIIFASDGPDYAEMAGQKAAGIQQEMAIGLQSAGLL